MKNALCLGIGLLVTLLFMLSPSSVFEAGFYETEFSNEMYNENLYLVVAVVTAAVSWGAAALFYYVINSVSFSRWYHWLVTMCAASLLTVAIDYMYPNSVFSDLVYDFTSQLASFCLFNFVVAAFFFVLASFSMRWWSSNCRHTPIPE